MTIFGKVGTAREFAGERQGVTVEAMSSEWPYAAHSTFPGDRRHEMQRFGTPLALLGAFLLTLLCCSSGIAETGCGLLLGAKAGAPELGFISSIELRFRQPDEVARIEAFGSNASGMGKIRLLSAQEDLARVIDVVGREIAREADKKFQDEVRKHARDNLFGITGTLYPSGSIAYVRGELRKVNGKDAVVMQFSVHARAKVDVGTRKWGVKVVRKIWAVDTKQRWEVIVTPEQKKNGSWVAKIDIKQLSATATKERQAKQKHANGFRDQITKELKKRLDRYASEHQVQRIVDKLKQKKSN